MYQLSKLLQSNMLDFKQYVVCTRCYSLYDFDDCFHVAEGLRFSNTCSYVEFPNHRLPHLRKRCNEPLLKEINNSSSKILVPYKIYCYKSIKSSLSFFVKRNNFEDLCEQWRTREKKKVSCMISMIVEYGMNLMAFSMIVLPMREIMVVF